MSDPAVTNFQETKPPAVDPSLNHGLSRVHWFGVLSMVAIVLAGVAGHATSTLKPLIIQAFVHSIGFDKATAGYLLTAEMISTSAGTIIATAFPFALRRRQYLFAALTLTMLANLASIPFKGDVGIFLYGLRCLSGLGAGFGLGRLGILIALSARPGRTAGFYSILTQLYGAVAAFAMPVITRLCGANSIFVILAGTIPLALVTIRWIPENHVRTVKAAAISTRKAHPLRLVEKLILSISFGVFYLGVGTFWPFISVLGETAGVDRAQITTVLGWGAIVSALGSVTAIFVGDRKASAPIITLVFLGLCLSVVLQLVSPRSFSVFVTSSLLFAYAYWVINPMILAVVSKLDTSGQMNGVYYVVAVGGISLGPALAGWVLTHGGDRFTSAALLRVLSVGLFASSSAVQTYFAFRAQRQPD
jgi:predicted MFS family arabinose efflux permease